MAVILLVDDDADNRAVYRELIAHHGHSCLEAENGEEAVTLGREHRPDLILMDIAMPLMSGWEARILLKHDPATARIPVVALTARTSQSDEEMAAELGFDAFVRKPARPSEVLELIDRLVRPLGERVKGEG